MKRIHVFFLSVVLIFFIGFNRCDATHIVGGELNYLYLGNNIYEVSLTVYRDCYNGIAPFDDPASIGVFDASGNLYSSSLVYIHDQNNVANVINSPCLTPPANVCYQVAHYIFTTVLPPRAGGYTLAYQRCCRNGTIANLANVNNTGATYFATIPDPAVAVNNSNPVFVNWPPTFICMNVPFTFDHSATDVDGDSLVYEVFNPYEGADPVSPMPQPPDGPPYSHVYYQSPYSYLNPFGGVPIQINSVTGRMTATPNALGQFVYGIGVKEYRNGQLISETFRDFQVNVVSCPQITVASIFSPTISCGSLEADFLNNSYNAATYTWNFGDITTTGDTSSLMNPSYEYPDTGDYWATLVAYSGVNPLCNDTAVGLVHVYPVFNANFGVINTHCTDFFQFNDLSYGIGGIANFWDWSFGDGDTSSQQYPTHTYANPGAYQVRFIASTDSACLDTVVRTIHVLPNPESQFAISIDSCTYTVNITDASTLGNTYQWSFGDSDTSSLRNPQHVYLAPGSYDILQTVFTDSLCVDTTMMHISLPPLPTPDFSYSVAPCDSNVTFTNLSTDYVSAQWIFGDNTVSHELSPQHTYELAGTIPVQLVVMSAAHCPDTLEKTIQFVSYKAAKFDFKVDSCSGIVNFIDVTENAVIYDWDFGDGTTSTEKNPKHQYSNAGKYTTYLKVNNETGCVDSARNVVTFELPDGEKIFVPNTFTPNGDGLNDYFAISVFRPCDIYSIEIFDRWGKMIYQNEDAAEMVWDGTYQGDQVPGDIYVYLLKREGMQRQGIVNVIR